EAKGATVLVERARNAVGRAEPIERAADDRAGPAWPVRRRVAANAATAHAAGVDAAIAARDADAPPGLLADELDVLDHTTGPTWDREGALRTFRYMLGAEKLTYRQEPLATLGDALALCRATASASGIARGKFDVGGYEVEALDLIEVDAQGRRRRAERF